jgi:hypothetical protein
LPLDVFPKVSPTAITEGIIYHGLQKVELPSFDAEVSNPGAANAPRLPNLQISSAAASEYRQRNRRSLLTPS